MTTEQRYCGQKIKLEWPDKSRLKIGIKLLRAKGFQNKLQTVCNSMGLASATIELLLILPCPFFPGFFFFWCTYEHTTSKQDTISSVMSFIMMETKPHSKESNPARMKLQSYHPLWFQSFFAGISISDILHTEKATLCSCERNEGNWQANYSSP